VLNTQLTVSSEMWIFQHRTSVKCYFAIIWLHYKDFFVVLVYVFKVKYSIYNTCCYILKFCLNLRTRCCLYALVCFHLHFNCTNLHQFSNFLILRTVLKICMMCVFWCLIPDHIDEAKKGKITMSESVVSGC